MTSTEQQQRNARIWELELEIATYMQQQAELALQLENTRVSLDTARQELTELDGKGNTDAFIDFMGDVATAIAERTRRAVRGIPYVQQTTEPSS